MRVVITGATGTIGRAVTDRLKARGDEVVALSRDARRGREALGVEVHEWDTVHAPPAAALEGADAVVHLLGEHEVSRLVVDLAGVRFVDSAGIGALLSTHERANDAGVDLELANASDPVRRILDMTGTGDVLAD